MNLEVMPKMRLGILRRERTHRYSNPIITGGSEKNSVRPEGRRSFYCFLRLANESLTGGTAVGLPLPFLNNFFIFNVSLQTVSIATECV